MAHERVSAPLHVTFCPTTVVGYSIATREPSLPRRPLRTAPRVEAEVGRYRLRLAECGEDREAACRLRFKVFNIEMNEGLQSSYETGLDTDKYDAVCEHLLVEDKRDRRVVGTYRMQSGATAAANFGYYSEQEFQLSAYEPLRSQILELGRATIDREHRTPEVLTLLWRGIAEFASNQNLRYLLGCSSMNSQNPAEGWQMYCELERYRVSPEFATEPTPVFACPSVCECTAVLPPTAEVNVPKLLRSYLAIGCRIGGPPAWDREFGTIDFLTFLDLELVTPSVRKRFLAPLTK